MGANAQTSVPAFTAGQVLTAAQMTQVNTGIPVFADSTARDAAFGGAGEKTLAEGQMAYLEDTNETQYYDGAAWAAVVAGAGGLVFISRTTIGSAVSSVAVSSVFSTNYDNYKVVGNIDTGSTSAYFDLAIGSANTGYYKTGTSGVTYGANGSSVIAYGNQNDSKFDNLVAYNTDGGGFVIELQSPFLALETKVQSLNTLVYANANGAIYFVGGFLNDTTSHTSMTFTTSTGTVTGGTIDVYGYAKA